MPPRDKDAGNGSIQIIVPVDPFGVVFLIKLLALESERRLHVDQAAELLRAGRDPDSARNNLHQAIFAARRALDSIGLDGSRYLELREELILLSPEDPVRIDAVAFEQLAAAARKQGEPGGHKTLQSRC